MTKTRNKSLIKQTMERDMGLCCCCGFRASEVHHIIPLTFGGKDRLDNLIAMCSMDHKHAPDTKEEFYEYVKRGGIMLDILIGGAINTYYNSDEMQKNFDLFTAIKTSKDIINILRKIDFNRCLEEYGAKNILN